MTTFDRILVATDLSEASKPALDTAIQLAIAFDAELTLVHVWEFPTYQYMEGVPLPNELAQQISDAAEKLIAATVSTLQQRYPKVKSVLKMGIPWQQVLDVVDEIKPNLLITGTHGRHGLKRVLLGSVAEKLVRMSPVPVLTVRGDDK